jgi:hypothetical protein
MSARYSYLDGGGAVVQMALLAIQFLLEFTNVSEEIF